MKKRTFGKTQLPGFQTISFFGRWKIVFGNFRRRKINFGHIYCIRFHIVTPLPIKMHSSHPQSISGTHFLLKSVVLLHFCHFATLYCVQSRTVTLHPIHKSICLYSFPFLYSSSHYSLTKSIVWIPSFHVFLFFISLFFLIFLFLYVYPFFSSHISIIYLTFV